MVALVALKQLTPNAHAKAEQLLHAQPKPSLTVSAERQASIRLLTWRPGQTMSGTYGKRQDLGTLSISLWALRARTHLARAMRAPVA